MQAAVVEVRLRRLRERGAGARLHNIPRQEFQNAVGRMIRNTSPAAADPPFFRSKCANAADLNRESMFAARADMRHFTSKRKRQNLSPRCRAPTRTPPGAHSPRFVYTAFCAR